MDISIEEQQEYGNKYRNLIESIQAENRNLKREKGYEIHHIVPRALGGDNSRENLIKLTCFEHMLVHYYKALETLDEKMIYCFSRMVDQHWLKITEVEKVSIEDMEYYSQLRIEGHKSGGHLGPVSEETRKKQSESRKKFYLENPDWKSPTQWKKGQEPWNKGKSPTEETKQKIKEARARQDMSWRHNWHPSDESRAKMSESHKGYSWWNNGVISVQAYECPEGFKRGKIFSTLSEEDNKIKKEKVSLTLNKIAEEYHKLKDAGLWEGSWAEFRTFYKQKYGKITANKIKEKEENE